MRVTLVFPPSLSLPSQPYYALPLLAGALRRAGHQPSCVDLNLACADRLLDRRTTNDLVAIAAQLERRARDDGDQRRAAEVRRHVEGNERRVRLGEECKQALRTPRQFYDGATFRFAIWTIVDALAAFYAADPVLSPLLPDFAARMAENQRRDAWTVMTHLHDHGLVDEVLASAPELIGVCLAFPEQAVETVRLLRHLRRTAPHVPICVGGPLLTGFADQWLQDGWLLDHCNFACLGDGEATIVELCEALAGHRGLDAVTNLCWRDRAGRLRRPGSRQLSAMDELPEPEFAACDLARHFLPEPIYPLMLSRGCHWGQCTFCSIGWRENHRVAGVEKIRRDVHAVARAGGRFVQLQDSSVPPAAARNLASVLREDGLPMHWVSGMKFERCHLDADYCRHIGGAGGCRSLLMGLEAADQRLLDLMQKGFQVDDVPAMLHNLRTAGVSVEMLWFIGFPTQTRADLLRTLRWLHERRDQYGSSAFVGDYLLHPGTEVFARPADFGVTVLGPERDRHVYEVTAGMQPEESALLQRLLSVNNNHTFTGNGWHLPHLAINGLDLGQIVRPMAVPSAVAALCGADDDGPTAPLQAP